MRYAVLMLILVVDIGARLERKTGRARTGTDNHERNADG